MEYKILHAQALEDLEERVRLHLEAGWKLSGGVSATIAPNWNYEDYHSKSNMFYLLLCQAVTKE